MLSYIGDPFIYVYIATVFVYVYVATVFVGVCILVLFGGRCHRPQCRLCYISGTEFTADLVDPPVGAECIKQLWAYVEELPSVRSSSPSSLPWTTTAVSSDLSSASTWCNLLG